MQCTVKCTLGVGPGEGGEGEEDVELSEDQYSADSEGFL